MGVVEVEQASGFGFPCLKGARSAVLNERARLVYYPTAELVSKF